MEAQLKSLVAERGGLKARLTRFKRFIETSSADLELNALERKTKAYEDLYEKFDKVQAQIETLVTGSDSEEVQLDEREEFENTFFALMAKVDNYLSHLRGPQRPVASPSTSSANITDSQNAPKLPTIVLPNFDGRYDQWVRFRDTFLTMVHNNDTLTDIQRFHYLNSALKGAAARTIESLGISESNYKLAWANLKRRFEDPDSLIHHHVNTLLDIPRVTHQTSISLREFIDKANNQLVALGALGEPVESWDTLVIILLAKKLDPKTFNEWDTHATNSKHKIKFIDFVDFIERQAKRLERAVTNCQTTAQVSHESKGLRMNRTHGRSPAVAVHISSTQGNHCALCNNDHLLQHCSELKKMAFPERHEAIKRIRACFNCLQQGHSIKNCTRGTCRQCGKRHHTLLHRDEAKVTTAPIDVPTNQVASCVLNSTSAAIEYTVLSTAVIYIEDKTGKKHECRALLDVGSQANFITDELSKRLGLPRSAIKTTVGGLGMTENPIQSRTNVVVHSRCNSFRADLSCLIIQHITEDMPNVATSLAKVNIPAHVTPADPHFNRQSRIDLLIGAGLFWKLLCIGQQKVESSDLVWQKTRLGWVLGGSINWTVGPTRKSSTTCHTATNSVLNRLMSQFWEIEEAPLSSTFGAGSPTDPSEVHFDRTTLRDKDGRYIVTIPFNTKVDELGQSRTQAENRLLGMERRFLKDPELHRQYVDFMTEYETLGHMTRITDYESINTQPNYYLPHHAVFKESSNAKKIRVVFDGSAKSSSGVSLNDAQLVGPTVQSDLFSILIRFRKHRLVLSADIEKMYRQILVHPTNRKFQRILWRPNNNVSIGTYELNTITYGTASAPFLATRVLQQIGLDCAQSFPAASRAIINDCYVDDLLTGCETTSEAITLRNDLTRILAQAGLPLRKWASNDSNVLESSHNAIGAIEIKAVDKDPKTLGLLWMSASDQLHYSVRDYHSKRITKRTILSEIAQIFDPLGLIGPVVTRAKLFMQILWELKVNWDETLPQHLHSQWSTFREELRNVSKITVPRRVTINDINRVEIHVFADASERAYGGCVYLRSINKVGVPTIRLLCAKSRVAPLKSTTLPRLELCAALLASQLAARVKCTFQMDFANEYYWSDSTIVLAWIKSPPSKWTKFVANRVSEIQHLTISGCWNHVSSNDNPADIISRGASPDFLIAHSLWWFGPCWLAQDASQWPSGQPLMQDIPEARKGNMTCLASTGIAPKPFDLFSRYSSYSKLRRVTAYCLKFTNAMLRTIRGNSPLHSDQPHSLILTTRELIDAERTLVRLAQREHFKSDIALLTENKPLTRSNLKSLNPFTDETGIIRVGGRLRNAPVSYDQRYPMILPAKHPLTTLIVEYEHRRLLHSGHQLTLSSIRTRFWPLTGKRVIKQILSKCIRCFRVHPTSQSYIMGDLPAARVSPARAFYTCGVDYAGPFLLKERGRSRVTYKSYICIFVCFTTKAVHIELATDLSTGAFLNCLYRFISRRGRSHCIYSDNGTNFVGARKELNELGSLLNTAEHNNRVQDTLAQEQIQWRFIPPYSPHFGGLWEGAVKSVKHHLKRVIGEQRLTFEELYTILTQVEACLNSRPLYLLSSDPTDLSPLTPGHFLIGDAVIAPPHRDLLHIKINRLNRYQLIQHSVQQFWKRWHREYLHELQQRHKWQLDSPGIIKVGSLVVIRDDNTPPLRWRLGRITDLHPGADGITRVVSIKVAEGVVKRPVARICVLPTAETDSHL